MILLSNQLCQNAVVLLIQKLLLNFLTILLCCGQVTFITDLNSETEVQKHATSIQYGQVPLI